MAAEIAAMRVQSHWSQGQKPRQGGWGRTREEGGCLGGGLCRDPGTRGRADGGQGRAPHLQALVGEGVERCCYSPGYALSSIK